MDFNTRGKSRPTLHDNSKWSTIYIERPLRLIRLEDPIGKEIEKI
jgi:hypothetical protein